MLSQVTVCLHVRRSLNCTSAEQQWQLKCSVCAIKPVWTAALIFFPFCPCKSLKLRISLVLKQVFFLWDYYSKLFWLFCVFFSNLWKARICCFILLFGARDPHPSSDWYCRQRFKWNRGSHHFMPPCFHFLPYTSCSLLFVLHSVVAVAFSKTLGSFAFMSVLNAFIIFISSAIS